MDHVVGWMQSKGLPQASARAYLTQHFLSLSTVAFRNPSTSLEYLRHEYSTKGGLNETCLPSSTKAAVSMLWRMRSMSY